MARSVYLDFKGVGRSRALSRSRRGAPPPPTLVVRRAAVAAFRARRGAAWNVPTVILHDKPEIVKNTDVQKILRSHRSCYDTVSILLTCNERKALSRGCDFDRDSASSLSGPKAPRV